MTKLQREVTARCVLKQTSTQQTGYRKSQKVEID